MDYIYTRVSTDKQTTENQIAALTSMYPSAIVVEEVGSGSKHRPILEGLLASTAAGDRIIVVAIDRLGRSLGDLVRILESLGTKGVVLVSQREGIIDKSTAMGSFIFNIMASVAQMERDILIERTRAGLRRTKAAGTKLGRRYTFPDETRRQIVTMRSEGHTLKQIAAQLKVSVSRVHEITKEGMK